MELSSAVVNGASFFRHINFDLLQRPNVQLRVDDGRNYLLTTRKRYDVVTADIILPRHAGAGALYSREYFQLVRDALVAGRAGAAVERRRGRHDLSHDPAHVHVGISSYTTLWADGTLMLGSVKPFELSRTAYEQRYQDPRFRELFDWNFEHDRPDVSRRTRSDQSVARRRADSDGRQARDRVLPVVADGTSRRQILRRSQPTSGRHRAAVARSASVTSCQ